MAIDSVVGTQCTSMWRSSFPRMRAWQANRNCRKRNCDTMPVSRTACRVSLQVADSSWATSSPGLSPPAVHACRLETHIHMDTAFYNAIRVWHTPHRQDM